MQIQENILKKKLVPVLTRCDEIKVGDIIRTNKGDLPVSKIMKSTIVGGEKEFVKFSQDCFEENYPERDMFITEHHPLSVGFLYNSDLNDGVYDETQDEKVFIHIAAGEFVGKIPGITKELKKSKTQYNFIFDEHCTINVGGIEVLTHHPSGFDNQPRLDDNEYHDKNVKKKLWKPFYIHYDTLIKLKPDDMELKEFLGKCLTSNPEKKVNIQSLKSSDNFLREIIDKIYNRNSTNITEKTHDVNSVNNTDKTTETIENVDTIDKTTETNSTESEKSDSDDDFIL